MNLDFLNFLSLLFWELIKIISNFILLFLQNEDEYQNQNNIYFIHLGIKQSFGVYFCMLQKFLLYLYNMSPSLTIASWRLCTTLTFVFRRRLSQLQFLNNWKKMTRSITPFFFFF